MDRRAFLGALASGSAAVLPGCTSRRETIATVSASPEIPPGEFYHETLRLDERGKQFNLKYEVTAEEPLDVFLFGGQVPPGEFETYRRAVAGADSGSPAASGAETPTRREGGAQPRAPADDHHGGRPHSDDHQESRTHGPGGADPDTPDSGTRRKGGSSGRPDGGPGNRSHGRSSDHPGQRGGRHGSRGSPDHHPRHSDWHSVMGTRRGEVNKPLRPGVHHFVVDNTSLGEAVPSGPVSPTIDLQVRDFEIFSG